MPAGSFHQKKRYGMIQNPAESRGFGFKIRPEVAFVTMGVMALALAWVIGSGGLVGGILVIGALGALPMIYAIVAYPKFGIMFLLTWSFLVMWIIRMQITQAPLGTSVDGLEALLILGFFIKQRSESDWTIMKNPISIMVIIWVGYNMFQVMNPWADSKMAWLMTVRSVAVVMLMYFIFSIHIRTVAFVKTLLKLWLSLVLFGALYANMQEHIGFLPFEMRWISDPAVGDLLFVGGFWRKFSIFSDPVAFSYNMVAGALLCSALLTGKLSGKQKGILAFLLVFFLVAMLYSGTRGSYFLYPMGMMMFSLLRFNKQVFFVGIVLGCFLFVMINMPTSSPILYRFQTAFKPSGDASFNVRTMNQQRLKPFIRSHAIGGGLGATGVWGAKYSPGSFLARVPPDSGFFRTAMELGWIGLLLFCSIMFVVLKQGIDNYYLIQDPFLKSVCLAMVIIIFALNIGNYPQEAFVQFPTNIFLYLEFALINVTLRLDRELRGETTSRLVVSARKKLRI